MIGTDIIVSLSKLAERKVLGTRGNRKSKGARGEGGDVKKGTAKVPSPAGTEDSSVIGRHKPVPLVSFPAQNAITAAGLLAAGLQVLCGTYQAIAAGIPGVASVDAARKEMIRENAGGIFAPGSVPVQSPKCSFDSNRALLGRHAAWTSNHTS